MTVPIYNAQQTEQLISFHELTHALREVLLQYEQGLVHSPDRQAVVIPQTEQGVILSMPAAAPDITIHKLISLLPHNPQHGLPNIQGIVSVMQSQTGRLLAILDGPTVTARRTAAVSMLGVQTFLPRAPQRIAIVGIGKQAHAHMQAIRELYPEAEVVVMARKAQARQVFVEEFSAAGMRVDQGELNRLAEPFDVVVTLTPSLHAFYHEPARAGRLVVAVGAFRPQMCEIGAEVVLASDCYVDDMIGAPHEAGDFIQAGKDWQEVRNLAYAIVHGVDLNRPILYKSVGCAAWDLAAAKVAMQQLKNH